MQAIRYIAAHVPACDERSDGARTRRRIHRACSGYTGHTAIGVYSDISSAAAAATRSDASNDDDSCTMMPARDWGAVA